jgi:hypothetical protein
MDKFNLLSDQPLKSEKDFEIAKFGHKEIAETLTSLITNCPTPFTIGLFGKWGAGKSTISYMLKKAMSEKKIGFILFDVWKHESDALRRTFLKESVKQLREPRNIPEDFNLEERIGSKITRKVEGQLQLKGFLKKYWKMSLLVFLCLILVGILIYQFLGLENLKSYLSTVLSIVAGGGILTAIISRAMSHFLTSETITYEIDRFKDPHEFQSEFEKLLSNLKTSRLLVIFDNLDRVTHEKAVETLATIKTFLETENIKDKGAVFLIPCDDQAIKEHLRNVYKLSDGEKDAFSEEEFLRKFFNTTLRIPEFYPTELETYAMELLSQTGLSELKEGSVAWLVTKAYRENPRQIKQFINQLIGMYILSMKRIEKNSLPVDFLAGNISKLAKFLILYNKFPNQMEKLRQDKIWDFEKVTSITTTDPDLAEFIKFVNETSHIPINNLNIFFTLRRSEFEVNLPGYDELAAALQDNRVDEVMASMKALPEFTSKRAILSQAIKKLLEEANLPDTKISIINSCLTALSRLGERLEDMVYVEVFNELSKLRQYLHIIEPGVIFGQLLKPYPEYRDDFAQIYVALLAQEDKSKLPVKFVEALLSEIIQHVEWFKTYTDKISNIIAEKYYDQPQIMQLLLVNEQTQKGFAVGKILQKTISTLSPADLETGKSFDEKLNLLIKTIPDVLDKELISITMKNLYEIFINENTKPLDSIRIEIKKRLSKGITLLLKKHLPSFAATPQDQLCQAVLDGINQIGDWGQRSIYIELLILSPTIGTVYSEQAISVVSQFIANAPFKSLTDAFEGRNEKEWNILLSDGNYTEHFKQRALREQQIFDYLYTYLLETPKRDWLLALLDVDANRGIQKIELLDRELPDIAAIIKKLIGITGTMDSNNRLRVYEIADKFKFAESEEILRVTCENTKKYLKTPDESNQKLGFELSTKLKSFKDSHRREIAREVIEWLLSLQPAQLYQQYAINAVLNLWDDIKGQTIFEKNFTEYIFRILLENRDVNIIRHCIVALSKPKPPYSEYSKYYDDLKHKMENEQDEAIKQSLIQGFAELKKLIGTKEPWWEWINTETEVRG